MRKCFISVKIEREQGTRQKINTCCTHCESVIWLGAVKCNRRKAENIFENELNREQIDIVKSNALIASRLLFVCLFVCVLLSNKCVRLCSLLHSLINMLMFLNVHYVIVRIIVLLCSFHMSHVV